MDPEQLLDHLGGVRALVRSPDRSLLLRRQHETKIPRKYNFTRDIHGLRRIHAGSRRFLLRHGVRAHSWRYLILKFSNIF